MKRESVISRVMATVLGILLCLGLVAIAIMSALKPISVSLVKSVVVSEVGEKSASKIINGNSTATKKQKEIVTNAVKDNDRVEDLVNIYLSELSEAVANDKAVDFQGTSKIYDNLNLQYNDIKTKFDQAIIKIQKLTEENYSVKVKIIVCDLSQKDGWLKIIKAVDENKISVDNLINNAGIGGFGAFSQAVDNFENDLEWAVIEDYPQLQFIKNKYPKSMMTGSGSTYFSLTEEFEQEDGYWIQNGLRAIPFGVRVLATNNDEVSETYNNKKQGEIK